MVGSGFEPSPNSAVFEVLAAGVPVPALTDPSAEAGTDAATEAGTDADTDAATDCSADAGTDCSADAGTDCSTDGGTDWASEHCTEFDLLFETTTSPDVSAMTPRTPPPLSWKLVPTMTFTSRVPVPVRPPIATDLKFDSTSAM